VVSGELLQHRGDVAVLDDGNSAAPGLLGKTSGNQCACILTGPCTRLQGSRKRSAKPSKSLQADGRGVAPDIRNQRRVAALES
jgi:hypothetical protein